MILLAQIMNANRPIEAEVNAPLEFKVAEIDFTVQKQDPLCIRVGSFSKKIFKNKHF